MSTILLKFSITFNVRITTFICGLFISKLNTVFSNLLIDFNVRFLTIVYFQIPFSFAVELWGKVEDKNSKCFDLFNPRSESLQVCHAIFWSPLLYPYVTNDYLVLIGVINVRFSLYTCIKNQQECIKFQNCKLWDIF